MDFKKLIAYQKSFELSMPIFEISKTFPKEETYSLTGQIRRSFHLVSSIIVESYRKRRYPNNYISKLTDADGENSEPNTWFDYAFACEYINKEIHIEYAKKGIEIGKLFTI